MLANNSTRIQQGQKIVDVKSCGMTFNGIKSGESRGLNLCHCALTFPSSTRLTVSLA
jgi:hypothetical protein